MPRCLICGADTILHVNGTPICMKCDREREDAKRINAEAEDERRRQESKKAMRLEQTGPGRDHFELRRRGRSMVV